MAEARPVVDLDAVRELAYFLFTIADNHRWTEPGLLFNGLGTSWFDIQGESRKPALSRPALVQDQLSYETTDE
jgi:putative DNA methylase